MFPLPMMRTPLLRKLSSTGGKFYNVSETDKLEADLSKKEATSVIHSEEKFDNLLNLKWVFPFTACAGKHGVVSSEV